jgi:hypothetical protein
MGTDSAHLPGLNLKRAILRKYNTARLALAVALVASVLPQVALAAPQVAARAAAPIAVATVEDPMPAQPDDFVRPEPATSQLKSEYTYVASPLSGTMKTTLVTVQLADKTTAQTESAVPMAAAKASLSAAAGFWANASAGRVNIALVNSKSVHKSAARSTQSPAEIADTVTKELGWTQASYTALVMFVPGGYLNNGAAGMTYSNGSIGGRILMPENSRLTIPVLAHEFGHTLGLDHANSLQCGSGASDVAAGPYSGFEDSSCSIRTYGDNLDVMGIAHYDVMPAISASFWEMGRFGAGNEITNLGTANSAKSVTLKPWAGQGAGRAAKFTDPKSGEVYFLELRAPVGYDAGIAVGRNRGVKITQQGGSNTSILLPPSTLPFSGYYSNSQAWQAGSTFSTHTGTRVTITSVSDSAATVTILPPGTPAKGSFDSAGFSLSGSSAKLDLKGWALDPSRSSASTNVHVYVTAPNGVRTLHVIPADQARPDVNQVLKVSGNHGFLRSLAITAAGKYEICAYAIGSWQNTSLGCKNVQAPGTPAPAGYLEAVSPVMESGQPWLKVTGWTVDPGTPAASIPVHIYVTSPDGQTTSRAFVAGVSRPDVNSVLGVNGSHGYEASLPLTQSGVYRVCSYGIAVSALPAGNSQLGCQSVTADVAASPKGFLDSLALNNSGQSATLQMAGWSFDPGSPDASIPVHLYVTGPDSKTTIVKVAADAPRNDVNAVMKIDGVHGYNSSYPITLAGTYKVCAYGIAVSWLSLGNSLLGCSTVAATPAAPPVGYLDDAGLQDSGSSAALTASGWTYEPASFASSNAVHVHVTGPDGKTTIHAFSAEQPRADVNAVMAVTGRHGFNVSIPITRPGQYKLCAYGISVSPLSGGNQLLGCRNVSAPAAAPAIGYLDTLRFQGTSVNKSMLATGWTLDPNGSGASIGLYAYVTSPNGATKGYEYTANLARADVNEALNVSGSHGYRFSVPVVARGKYTVCTYGVGIAALKSANGKLGCISITY